MLEDDARLAGAANTIVVDDGRLTGYNTDVEGVRAALFEAAGGTLAGEPALILGAGMILAAGLGWLLSVLLVAMLQHVFDPPPDSLAVPWLFLAGLAAAAVLGAAVAIAIGARSLRRMPLGSILREQ